METLREPEKTVGETQREGAADLKAVLADLRAEMRAEALDLVKGIVTESLTPDRSQLAEIAGGDGVEVERVSSVVRFPYEHLYARLPEHMQKIRSVESDFDMARYIRAQTYGDHASMREVVAKYGVLPDSGRQERATTAEGATTAVSGLSGGTGGPLIPLPLANVIITTRDNAAVMRSRVTVFTSAGKTLRIPTSGSVTAEMIAEGADGAQVEPTLGSKLLDKQKMRARMRASEEMLEDTAFNLVTFFGERAGGAFGVLEDHEVATGDGTPSFTEGFDENTSIAHLTETTSTELIFADMMALWFLLGRADRRFSSWFMSDATLAIVSQLLDGNGRGIFQIASEPRGPVGDVASGGVAGSIFNRPVVTLDVADGNIYIGDLKKYGMLDGGGIRMRVLDQVAAATDDIEYRFTQRVDGAVLEAAAFKSMEGIASIT